MAARELAVPVRTLARWLAASRELAARVELLVGPLAPWCLGFPGEALAASLPFQGQTGAVARAVLADWLDARRRNGA